MAAYVALSRATSMEQLQVLNFDPAKYVPFMRCVQLFGNTTFYYYRVVAHPRVLAWHDCVPESMCVDDDIDAGEDDEMDNDYAKAAYYMT